MMQSEINKRAVMNHKQRKGNFFTSPNQGQGKYTPRPERTNVKSKNVTSDPVLHQRKTRSHDGNTEPRPGNREKKPFDKKKWRFDKYSKKYKLQQWEDKRKKAVLNEYYKNIKDDQSPEIDVQKLYVEMEDDQETSSAPTRNEPRSSNPVEVRKKSFQKRAHLEFLRIKEEKQKRKEEALQRKLERGETSNKYKRKKIETSKKLNKKTKKGQPIMSDRMKMLLEKIQSRIDS